jgi:lysophospholipid acyltransferase (LPLAT)-like uncharacterized protein
MLRRFLRRPGVQASLARLLGRYLAFVHRSSRWQVTGTEHLDAVLDGGRAGIATFWHENLPLMPEVWRLGRERHGGDVAHVLVSRHRDGRLIGEVVARFHLTMVYASSSKGGATGMRALLRLLREGQPVAITPDGPRGPHRKAAPGVAQIAGLSGLPVLPCAAFASRAVPLKSWDRMRVPLPFSRIRLVIGPPVYVAREQPEAALPAIEAALNAVQAAAER